MARNIYLAADEFLLRYGAITTEQYLFRKAAEKARKYVRGLLKNQSVRLELRAVEEFQSISIPWRNRRATGKMISAIVPKSTGLAQPRQ
jgi:hypothetical protein